MHPNIAQRYRFQPYHARMTLRLVHHGLPPRPLRTTSVIGVLLGVLRDVAGR